MAEEAIARGVGGTGGNLYTNLSLVCMGSDTHIGFVAAG